MRDDDDDDEEKSHGPSVLTRVGGFFAGPFLYGLAFSVIGFAVLSGMLPKATLPDAALVPVSVTAPEQAKTEATTPALETAAAQTPTTPVEEPKAIPVIADTAILITDVGLNRRVAQAIDKNLPREISLAISAYATDPAATARAFDDTGRDIWLNVAAESTRAGIDPGPLALSQGLSAKENTDLLKRQMAGMSDSVTGIFIPDDANITADSGIWREVALGLIASNKMVLDATTAKVATELYVQKAESKISAYLKSDFTVDGALPPEDFKKALAALNPKIITARESIVVITHPTVLAVEATSEWIKSLTPEGIRLVHASHFTGLKP